MIKLPNCYYIHYLQVGASYLIVDLGEPGNRLSFWEYSCTGVEKNVYL